MDTFVQPKRVIGRSTEDLAHMVVAFGELLCGIKLYHYQKVFAVTIVRALLLRNGDSPTALYSRQSGKTEAIALVAIACAVLLPALAANFPEDDRVALFAKGVRIGIYAPKLQQAKLSYDRIRSYAASERAQGIYMDPDINVEMSHSRGDSCAWTNGSLILAETASDTVDNEGQTWHLLICDEAQRLSQRKVTKQLNPMLASTNGPMVQIGTPNSVKGAFWRTIQANLSGEKKTGKRLHFQYDWKAVVKERRAVYDAEAKRFNTFSTATPRRQALLLEESGFTLAAQMRPNPFHLNYEAFVQNQLEKLDAGEEDESFKMNFRLIWADNRDIAIPSDVWERAAIADISMNECAAMFMRSGFIVAGLDVAKGNGGRADKTVLTFIHVDTVAPIIDNLKTGGDPVTHYRTTVIGVVTCSGSFEHEQYGTIVTAVRGYGSCVRLLLCDSTGMGDPVTERLGVLLSDTTTVEGVTWSSHANKSRCYRRLIDELKAGRMRYADGPGWQGEDRRSFHEQVSTLQRYYTASGFLLCEASSSDEHDDFPDSMAIASHAVVKALEYGLEDGDVSEEAEIVMSTMSGISRSDPRQARITHARRGFPAFRR